jgi:hypothetical protein
MKRNSFLVLACSAMAIFLACSGSKSPTRPSTTIVGLDVAGPASVAPGASAQFTATGRQVDGGTKDVTSEVHWASSDPRVLSSVNDGRFAGVALGDARVFANLSGTTAGREVVVVPPGTFRIAGLVTEADPQSSPVIGATVSIIGGSGDGLSTTTGGDGRYRLYGVGGDVRIRVTKEGYEPFEQANQVTDHAMVNAELRLLKARRDVSGRYRLTIAAAEGCRLELPEPLRTRNYTATVTMTGNQIDVALEDANFAISGKGQGNQFHGRSEPNALFFTLTRYDDVSYFYYKSYYGDLVEALSPSEFLVVAGKATAFESGSGFAGTLDGAMTVYSGKLSYFPKIDSECKSNSHRIVFSR